MSCKILGCKRQERPGGHCAGHEQRVRRNGSATTVRCPICQKTFEKAEIGGPRTCDVCVMRVRCTWCSTPVVDGLQRAQKYPWCGECRRKSACRACADPIPFCGRGRPGYCKKCIVGHLRCFGKGCPRLRGKGSRFCNRCAVGKPKGCTNCGRNGHRKDTCPR